MELEEEEEPTESTVIVVPDSEEVYGLVPVSIVWLLFTFIIPEF